VIAANSKRVVALCGGIGGAKLALGLSHILGPKLTVIVNTGDDFEHLGLYISPDVDTVLYTLAGLNDQARGWGRADETWNFMAALREVGGESWFNLGDRDLALHVERTRRLRAGETLTAVTTAIAQHYGIVSHVLPMSDDPVRTTIVTPNGRLLFQRYFVEHQCRPVVHAVHFEGAETAQASAAALAVFDQDLAAIVICPSNPYLSVDPILAIPKLRARLAAADVPIVAVSPIIAGRAVKGPTVKIMNELGIAATHAAIAEHYRGIVDGLVIDAGDESSGLAVPVRAAPTLMTDFASRVTLARTVLAFAGDVAASGNFRERRA
jgi:LPPG:FO 2-phospho-L-lactate transferase